MEIYQVTYHFHETIAGLESEVMSHFTSNIYYRANSKEDVKEVAINRFKRCFPTDNLFCTDVEEITVETIITNKDLRK